MVPPDSGRIPPVPPYSGYSPLNIPFSHTGLSPSSVVLSRTLPLRYVHDLGVLQPRKRLDVPGLGSSAFARHYSRNHYCFLLLKVLRCFSSLRSPLSQIGDRPSTCRVAPFGYPRIYAYLQLPEAFRSLSRPSSPPRAKASTIRPYLLLYFSRFGIATKCDSSVMLLLLL